MAGHSHWSLDSTALKSIAAHVQGLAESDASGRAVRTYVGDALATLEAVERDVEEYRDPLRF
jgi:hypothetical protein